VINFVDDAAEFPRLIYNPRNQEDLISDALEYLFSQCEQASSTLARVRFEEAGFQSLGTSFDLFEDPSEPDWNDPKTFELFYYRISRSWTYRGNQVATGKYKKVGCTIRRFGLLT
jgi:hypothetical protein